MLKVFFDAAGADARVEVVTKAAATTTARTRTPFLFTSFIVSLSGEFEPQFFGVFVDTRRQVVIT
ncbi:unannotated protein [freshwater metagenome]|uniref:Unannotated protein n=1 Tax=freshwater metagenome TaxID=449393 RepID=A0A6J7L6C0_9ZZZZ